MTLRFDFDETDTEIRTFLGIAKDFLAGEAPSVLQAWRDQLKSIRTARSNELQLWEITEQRPIWTSRCEPESNARNPRLIGCVSAKWQIEIPPDAPRGKGNQSGIFALAGVASTRLSLFQDDREPDSEVARWCFEIGDPASPGCHFHTQVKSSKDIPFFPPTLSVPRLPGVMVTPIDAIEFLLGEMFQESWAQTIARDGDLVRSWSRIQQSRMKKLLKWQHEVVTGANVGPGWGRLKRAKPNVDLFLPR